jgi:hypothetical protein
MRRVGDSVSDRLVARPAVAGAQQRMVEKGRGKRVLATQSTEPIIYQVTLWH